MDINSIKFTLVSTVFNEINRLDDTLSDLSHQTLQPAEIVITDAGSTDGTYEALLKWRNESSIPIKILKKVGCNVAAGRNMAIESATHNLIASTDFGCRFHPKWLESLISPFQNQAVIAVAGGYGVVEEYIETLAAKAAFLIYNGYKINYTDFIPSSRSVAYYKHLFFDVGKYCEWLTLAADDTLFGLLAKEKGYVFSLAKQPYVYWGRHKTANAYKKEFYRYGLGDGEAHISVGNARSIFITLLLRICFLCFLIPILCFSLLHIISPLFLLLLLPLLYGFRSYFGYTKNWLQLRSVKYNFKVFVYGIYLFEATRYSYLKGFYKGYYKSPLFRREQAKRLHQQYPSLHNK